MQEQTEYFVGIDTSQEKLEVAVRNAFLQFTKSNTMEGIQTLVDRLKPFSPELIVIEETGGLELDAARVLYLAAMSVTVANPQRPHAFARAIGELAKMDEIEAGRLSRFAEAIKPELSRFRMEEEKELVALVRCRKTLVEARAK